VHDIRERRAEQQRSLHDFRHPRQLGEHAWIKAFQHDEWQVRLYATAAGHVRHCRHIKSAFQFRFVNFSRNGGGDRFDRIERAGRESCPEIRNIYQTFYSPEKK
jgi:hypothetical protein